jgi:hypothetical protein
VPFIFFAMDLATKPGVSDNGANPATRDAVASAWMADPNSNGMTN